MTTPFFTQKSPSEERATLLGDDALCTKTKTYLKPLINATLARQKISTEEARQLYDKILSDIPIARERFFSNARNITENTKFSVYFGWYIAQRINGRKKFLDAGQKNRGHLLIIPSKSEANYFSLAKSVLK